jgi:SAM-dependent methyltransferase
MRFTYHGEQLDGIDEPYNYTAQNERAVELAVAFRFVDEAHGDGLEVGNVLGHYGVRGHRVVDLFESGKGVENVDVFDVAGEYDWIVSISTVEHVHYDTGPRDSGAALAAIRHMESLLAPGGRMLVTVPMGHNPTLDESLVGGIGTERACTLTRHGKGWRQTKAITPKPYGATTPWAESVWIGEFRR